ncbi:16S rRNA m(2)G 1207 methyltransferase [Alteracholeplasma palmae J233]|uniref:16S rRNA m(2)G 1207 methyltransferase n=1 Tax=Alteracholeplasma palmae (strain ATCC 49389 / J233) TaxID=1318466 RepID=U4KS95_ALTPJ|nr:class I SAM-dependent methyltransferase [Alteracholeplasma palmae]CCV64851.1 16S rRNA m(2)G 1207 methyltransferase [Alteracholeplasma palmae J233]
MSHYFINDPSLKSDVKQYEINVNDVPLVFKTDSGVFSKEYLDFGTRVLLETITIKPHVKKVLDMGCGYGPIGTYIGKINNELDITMADINTKALELTKQNLKANNIKATVIESDLFSNIKEEYDLIITNPPIRTGKDNIFKLYEEAYKKLRPNGELWLVIQKKQGAPSTIKKLETLFNNCTIAEKKKGYYIIYSIK